MNNKNITVCLLFLLLGVLFFIPAVQAEAEIMHFPDRNLETAVRHALNRPAGILTPEHMLALIELNGDRHEIQDLTGLEKAVNLESISLYGNRVENLAPLAGLTALRSLNLYHNRISDLAPLSALSSLEELYLGGNSISNLSPLSALTGLRDLYLFENRIHNISPLSALTNVENLNLNHNNITNFSPLQNLQGKLTRLSIRGNRYQNISFLKPLTGLNYLELGNDTLEDITPLAALTQLEQLQISGSQVSNIEALASLTSLEWLSLENNRISDLTPLAALPELEYLNLNGNSIRDLEALPALKNLGWLEIRNNLLDVENETPEMVIIRDLLAQDISVSFAPQMLPRYRGNAAVWVPDGATGTMVQTTPAHYFTILNHSIGWRIQSFTVEHEGGMARDYLREVGRYDLEAGQFAWYATPGRYQPNVEDGFPYTITLRNPSTIQLGLSVFIWPGYTRNDARLFYLSEITLWNIHTKSSYTIELDPPKDMEIDGALEEEQEAGPLLIEAIN